MKYLLLFMTCFGLKASAQNPLVFNKQFTESANKWVALKTPQDTIFGFGFIYMDPAAGLSAREGGVLYLGKDNKLTAAKRPPEALKVIRLDGMHNTVAWIPSNVLKQLDLPENPDWIKFYKADTTSAQWLFRWGFSHNAANEPAKALYYLDRVQKIDPNYPGLEFEYIFAYNAGKQHDKAIALIEAALKKRPQDGKLYKELLYAQVLSGQINKAEETYKTALSYVDIDIRTEMAMNIASNYLMQKNKEKFKLWADDIQTWIPVTNRQYGNFLKMKEYYATLK